VYSPSLARFLIYWYVCTICFSLDFYFPLFFFFFFFVAGLTWKQQLRSRVFDIQLLDVMWNGPWVFHFCLQVP
jgi:hypothetical protein